LVLLAGFLIWDYYKIYKKHPSPSKGEGTGVRPKFDILDYLIISYIGYLVVITLVNGL
jgi:hypothetical protein